MYGKILGQGFTRGPGATKWTVLRPFPYRVSCRSLTRQRPYRDPLHLIWKQATFGSGESVGLSTREEAVTVQHLRTYNSYCVTRLRHILRSHSHLGLMSKQV